MIRKRLRRAWKRISGENDYERGVPGESGAIGDGDEAGRTRSAGASNGPAGRSRTESESESESEPEPVTVLFECPECGNVYIDVDKETCRICRADVTAVRSTVAAE